MCKKKKGLPNCENDDHHVQKLLQEVDLNYFPNEACIDLFVAKENVTTGNHENFPVIVHCSTLKGTNFPPRIVNLRKCCRERQYYDFDAKFCRESTLGSTSLLNYRSIVGEDVNFVIVYKNEAPICRNNGVIVDYKIPISDVYHDVEKDDNIKVYMSIPVYNV